MLPSSVHQVVMTKQFRRAMYARTLLFQSLASDQQLGLYLTTPHLLLCYPVVQVHYLCLWLQILYVDESSCWLGCKCCTCRTSLRLWCHHNVSERTGQWTGQCEWKDWSVDMLCRIGVILATQQGNRLWPFCCCCGNCMSKRVLTWILKQFIV